MKPRDNDNATDTHDGDPGRVIRIIVAANILGMLAVALALYRHLMTLGALS